MRFVISPRLGALALLTILGSTALVGCGNGVSTYPVYGKVVANGKPVEGGTLNFAPVASGSTAASSPVLAVVQADGSFSVPAGAVSGKQTVSYSAPAAPPPVAWEGQGKRPVTPKSPWVGFKPKVPEVEIQPSKNELTIELTK